MTTPGTALASHRGGGEHWRLRPNLTDRQIDLALSIQPVLTAAKRSIIGLGGQALVARNPEEISTRAGNLERDLATWQQTAEDAGADPTGRLLHDATVELASWASAVAHEGHVSVAAAAGLRAGYRRLREAAAVWWYPELVPEGHALLQQGGTHG